MPWKHLKETWYGISGYSKFEHEMSSIPILRHRSYLPLNFSHFDRVNKSLFKKIWKLHMVLVRYFSHNFSNLSNLTMGPSLPWSYVSWIYNYLCNQCLSPLKLWVRTRSWRGVLDTTLYDKVCQWLAADRLFSPGTLVSSTNKTCHHDIIEILLKVALSTISQP
jgi:hypothetical protein